MKIDKFEDIDAWKEARILVKSVYEAMENIRDYGFRDQIQRASISIMSNIAEGFDRGTNKEFIYFLTIARGSVAEVRSLLYAAQDIGYIEQKDGDRFQQRCSAIAKMINGFIRYLKSTSRLS
ncbi:MAG TPA: four helix bundle protein [Desulfuromonadales bacterium]|nr:four helix bundle protein [Desulfuromonadales bacterium]